MNGNVASRLPWSAVITAALVILATLPAFEGPRSFSLDTRLGKYLYLASLTVLAIGYVVAVMRENLTRDETEASRHDDLVARLEKIEEATVAKRNSLVDAGLSAQSPEIVKLDQKIAATHNAIIQLGGVFRPTGELSMKVNRRGSLPPEH